MSDDQDAELERKLASIGSGASKPKASSGSDTVAPGVVVLCLVLMGIFAWWMATRGPNLNADRPVSTAHAAEEMEALVDCQMAIKAVSRDRSKVSAPYRKSSGTGPGDYFFAWPSGAGLEMPNGLGIVMPATAACYHDGKKITALTINGKDVAI